MAVVFWVDYFEFKKSLRSPLNVTVLGRWEKVMRALFVVLVLQLLTVNHADEGRCACVYVRVRVRVLCMCVCSI